MKRKQPTSSPRRVHHTRELPAWYRRLVIITIIEDRDIEPYDFDEDISELGEGEGDSDRDSLGVACECGSEDECECGSEDECECGSEDECECDPLDEDEDDEESEHSYTGSDADYYYELKEQRTDRKMELRNEKRRLQEDRTFTRELESRNEQEVHAAYEAMLEAQKRRDCPRRRLESIAGKTFYLYSVDHVDHCYNYDLYPSKYVEFYHINADDGEVGNPPDQNAKITGHAYMNVSSGCSFVPFCPPKSAGSQGIRLKVHGSDDEPAFQFISDKYLIMTVGADSEMTRKDIRESEPADVPDAFKFAGIHMDFEERKQQMRRNMEERRSRRPPSPPSPRETFFERCHPMGAWKSGWP
ncbi:hypothetical protein C2857_003510 [Epichloe festucae Fl1]|uniref:Uncharacterized protein n=1 Tax=Epichloe festucae (strain Fl1) TaxID=877507 RepID=A0A7S9KS43_EPIFF|nr:hypothetical protein C2857_003510 [Epichloe festucae Fl1]